MATQDRQPKLEDETYYILGSIALFFPAGLLWLAANSLFDQNWLASLARQWYHPFVVAGIFSVMAVGAAVALLWVRESEHRRRSSLQETFSHKLQEAYAGTLQALVTALDLRDSETWGHSRRVLGYSMSLGRLMGLTHDEMSALAWGALLHDVGKLGIPDHVLFKSEPLVPDERRMIKEHVEIGYRLISAIPYLHPALDVVRHHHECFDGTGYPTALKGSGIPLTARIFAVADAFDAMTSSRPYRRQPRTFNEARLELKSFAATQFDPEAVEAFCGISDETLQQIQVNSYVSTMDPRQFFFRQNLTDTHQLKDLLTGTFSRNSWEQFRIQMTRLRGFELGGVMFCDVDGLKAINDRFGHQLGDEVLTDVGHQLAASVGPVAIVYRYGGDEFIVWFPPGTNTADLTQRVADTSDRIASHWHQPGVNVALSWGLAQADDSTNTLDELVHRADERMYHQKAARTEFTNRGSQR